MILVISGGGARGFYALGVLKALDEIGISKDIKAIYGVSAGAILASFYSAGISPDEILNIFLDKKFFYFYKLNLNLTESLLSYKPWESMFREHLPKNIEDLKIKTYIGATDMKKVKFQLFEKGDLLKPLLGSISIPGIYPGIKYNDKFLVDGGVLNNFPVDLAKKNYSKEKIIGISLNNIVIGKQPKNVFENLMRTFEMMVNHTNLKGKKYVDVLFEPNLGNNVFDVDKKSINTLFNKGYQDGLNILV